MLGAFALDWQVGRARMAIDRRGFLSMMGVASVLGARLCANAALNSEFDENLSVFLSDIHVVGAGVSGKYSFTRKELDKRIDEILSIHPRPRRVVTFGDLAFNHGEKDSYEYARSAFKRLQDIGIKVVHGLGNHDRRDAFLEVFPEFAKTTLVEGAIVHEVDLGACDLILFESDNSGMKQIVQERFNEILAARKRPFLAGSHHPSYLTTQKIKDVLLADAIRDYPLCAGWVHGHKHFWSNRENMDKTRTRHFVRDLCLPSGGIQGDIGLVILRTYPDRAVATLHQKGFWYGVDLPTEDDVAPDKAEFTARTVENDGQICTFSFARKNNTQKERK